MQIASDIHLEFHDDRRFRDIIKPVEPVLALLGDIGSAVDRDGRYRRFLVSASVAFEKVLVIAGNHEYYGLSIDAGNEKMRKMVSNLENVYFLDNETVKIDDETIVFGSTFWSHIPSDMENGVRKYVNDYRKIIGLTVQKTNDMHKAAIDALTKVLDELSESGNNMNVIVLSHHAPTFLKTSSPEYEGNDTNCAFATNLEHIMKNNQLKVWCYGHTHWNNCQLIHETTVCSNQLGFDGECYDYDDGFSVYGPQDFD